MTLTSVEERRYLTDSVRAATAAVSARSFLADGDGAGAGTDEALWAVLSREIGLAGLLVPEELGGADAGVAEVAAVLGELGSRLAPVPGLASLGMAGPLLAVAGNDERVAALRTRLAEGMPAAVAWPHPEGTDVSPTLRRETAADGSKVTGAAAFVLDGMVAEVVFAPAASPDGVVLVAVATGAAGVRRTPMTAFDLTRGLAEITFDDAPATVLTDPRESSDFLAPGLDIALTCIAAEQVGIAARCHADAVAWAKERVQFDRAIGSFQVIKHTLVDLLQDLELSRSSLDVAVAAADAYLDAPSAEAERALRVAASAAKAMCADAATRITDEALHIFGGLGFTWEHDSHLYFRRARSLELLLGAPDHHRARLAAALGVGG
jgi:alkylation response protein AidB-like acyl-CoA dehydrogenase